MAGYFRNGHASAEAMAVYADWTPASVFGASTPATAEASRLAKPDVLRARRSSDLFAVSVSEEEWRVATGAHNTDRQQVNDIKGGATSSSSSKQPKTRASSKRKKAGDVGSSRKDDVDNAIRALQLQSRVRRLYAQEKAHEREAQTLRRALETAAIALLSQSFQRYRLRCAIGMYLCQFEREETAVRRLLQRVEQAKLDKETAVSLKREKRRQHALRAAQFLWTWYKCRQLIRRDRVKRSSAGSRIATWWRTIRLQRRCETRRRLKEALAKRKIQRSLVRQAARRKYLREQSRARIQRAIYHFVLRKRLAKARLRDQIEGARRLAMFMRAHCLAHVNRTWKDHVSRSRDQIKQQQRQTAAARVLGRFLHQVVVSYRQRVLTKARIVLVQSLIRRHHARKRYLQYRADQERQAQRRQREHVAIVRIQARIRGIQERVRFARILKQIRERFQCSNCGVIEPGGVYCKLCGRRRTNFEPLRFSSKQYVANARIVASRQQGPPVSAMVPTPPVTLHASSSKSVRIGRHRRLSDPSSYDRSSSLSDVNGDLLTGGALTTLPAVLSPRHHLAAHSVPIVPILTMVGASTKVRAQTLVGLQIQQERAGHTQAMTLHLQRLQRGSQAVRRSR